VSNSKDKKLFKARVFEWADKLDVQIRSLAIRPMRNKWASCSTAGNVNFNQELLAFDRDVADYVIVHELLHFFVPNHGKLWKSLMRAHLGAFEAAEKKLQTATSDKNPSGSRASPTKS
jgi:predicted metal-dependent hydrolase